jgi:DNA-binding transcriptional regulator YdaS (Cro superfamily)
MELHVWLDHIPGSSQKLALHLGVNKTQVSQWKTQSAKGLKRIPCKYLKAVRDFTHNAVTLEELVPEWPGIQPKKQR